MYDVKLHLSWSKPAFVLVFMTLLVNPLYSQFEEKMVDGEIIIVSEPSQLFLDATVAPSVSDQMQRKSAFNFHSHQLSTSSFLKAQGNPSILNWNDWGVPTWIVGEVKQLETRSFDNSEQAALAYLDAIESILPFEQSAEQLKVIATNDDPATNMVHVKIQQFYAEVPVFGGEVWIHLKNERPQSMTGRMYPVKQQIPTAFIPEDQIDLIIKKEFSKNWAAEQPVSPGHAKKQIDKNLFWYPINKSKEIKLAYVAEVYPDYLHRYNVVIDAVSGELLEKYMNMCFLHPHSTDEELIGSNKVQSAMRELEIPEDGQAAIMGDESASGIDLFGINRNFQVINEAGTYYMIDISRPMYNASASVLPSQPVGAIRTVDGMNNPFIGSINYSQITSFNNTWNDPASVSAHYNAGITYEYFVNTFNRNSINNAGFTITSFIHVNDQNGQAMDNAFWNGEAMFYGDGRNGFFSLARGLDVAGHEISHGVVQTTANLVYQGEPGALNESFADIFGAMIDRDDWLIGEDVVRSNVFPTGALRSMQDPTQGLSSLSQPGYQPGHYTDRYIGPEDNGGVHFNSGIPNRAFYLFATAVGKATAEQVYYHALTNYLTRSSDFLDCRAAVMQAALDLYGTSERDAAADAFSQVGIGSGMTGGDLPTDELALPVNPGDDYIVFVNASDDNIWMVDDNLNILADPLSSQVPISKPSISDNGSRLVFINDQNNIYFIAIDWSVPEVVDSRELTTSGDWRNVSISKDGGLVAAIKSNPENSISVFDLSTGYGQSYVLTNPTTGGVSTGDVLYADALEFDYSGENLLYDAVNEITGTTDNIRYWDIGILRVWNNQSDDFGDGHITKLFAGLPEGISIGNPVLSKTRPNVLAYDVVEEGFFSDSYFLFASNAEVNTTAEIFENTVVSYPSYSKDDNRIVFNAENYGQQVVGQINLLDDRITPSGNATIFLNGGHWANWFANGIRDLNVGVADSDGAFEFTVTPNPASERIIVEVAAAAGPLNDIYIFNLEGQRIDVPMDVVGGYSASLRTKLLTSGFYIVECHTTKGVARKQIIIQHN